MEPGLYAFQYRDNKATLEHIDASCLFILAASHHDLIRFAPLPLQDSKLLVRQRPAMFHISWSRTATECLQSLPCENDKLKRYMCGLTCTTQESHGWITHTVCVCVLNLSSLLGGGWCAGLSGASGKKLSPTHLPPWAVAPYISARGIECHFLLLASHYISLCRCGFFPLCL